MIVAVAAVRVVQMAVDQIVDVVAVRHRLVAAPGSVLVPRLVPGAAVVRRAAVGIAGRHLDDVLIDVIAMRMVQVAVVQIVDVARRGEPRDARSWVRAGANDWRGEVASTWSLAASCQMKVIERVARPRYGICVALAGFYNIRIAFASGDARPFRGKPASCVPGAGQKTKEGACVETALRRTPGEGERPPPRRNAGAARHPCGSTATADAAPAPTQAPHALLFCGMGAERRDQLSFTVPKRRTLAPGRSISSFLNDEELRTSSSSRFSPACRWSSPA